MPYNFAPDSFHTGVTAEALRPLCPLIVNCYVIFHLLGISVKFHDDSFIGCQDICENALHWLVLEVLPKKRFFGHKWGVVDPWNKIIP